MDFKEYTYDDIRQELRNLIYPRESFIIEDNFAYKSLFNQVLDGILNAMVFSNRYIEMFKNNRNIDLELNEALVSSVYTGCRIGKILNIYCSTVTTDFFNAWRVRFASNPNFLTNLLRYNQDFREFVLSYTVYNQIRQRFSNTNIDWNVIKIGKDIYKIILGNSFNNIDKVMVVFLPYFIKYDDEISIYDENENIIKVKSDRWFFSNKEYSFLIRYLLGNILYKEGLALSEIDITGSSTNKETLMTEGKDIMEKAILDFKSFHTNLTARRIS